jgi:hypothetical protein
MPKTAIHEWIREKLKALSAADCNKYAPIRIVKPELKVDAVYAFESQEEYSFHEYLSYRDVSDGGVVLEVRAKRVERVGVASRGRKVKRGYGGRGKWMGLNNSVEPIVLRYTKAIKEDNTMSEKQIMRVNKKWEEVVGDKRCEKNVNLLVRIANIPQPTLNHKCSFTLFYWKQFTTR